jgi:hypothetical protein
MAEARQGDKRAVRLLGVSASNLVPNEYQIPLGRDREQRREALSAAVDRMRRKYGRRSLQSGSTAFDGVTSGEGWRHEKSVGLSAQLGGPTDPA